MHHHVQTADDKSASFIPVQAVIEGISVTGFPTPQALFQRVIHEINRPGQSVIFHLNVHGANMAHRQPRWKQILQQADVAYCDGAGIVWASLLQGTPLPTRLTAADWLPDLLAYMARAGKTIYFLGGKPGIAQKAMAALSRHVPQHTVVGMHHGYIHQNPALTQQVIAHINTVQPDLLIVGFGMPLQEYWINTYRHQLKVPAIWAMGATLDYFAGKVPRCPQWMGTWGLEWLFRLGVEPRRMFQRYILGNPWFLSRIVLSAMREKWQAVFKKPQTQWEHG